MRRFLLLACLVVAGGLQAQVTPGRAIAITFDDLPDLDVNEHRLNRTEMLMRSLTATLLREHVPAIGFLNEDKLLDEQAQSDPRRVALISGWLGAGLEIGNHTFSHLDLHQVSVADYEQDILLGERITRGLVADDSGKTRWFRHPYLNTGRSLEERALVERFLSERGYRVAPVTIDSSEWIYDVAYDQSGSPFRRWRIRRAYLRYMESQIARAEVLSWHLFSREIPQVLLLHASVLNAASLPSFMAMLRRRGYRFVPLAEATADRAYASPDPWVADGGVSWLERWALGMGMADQLPAERAVDPFVSALAGVQTP